MKVKIYKYESTEENLIMTTQMKPYKQLKRIVDKLKQINKDLTSSDFKNNKIRYYIYKVDDKIIFTEDDLNNYDIKQ